MPEIIIPGPEGRLEGRYSPSEDPQAPLALILHPDPRYGGTMNNKVTYTLYHCFVKLGFVCLRFNFRGVGRSQGEYSKGEGELSDAAVALDWLQNQNPNARYCWIAGFSFGAWIAMQVLMRRPDLQAFVAIAPPANLYDFSFLVPCPTSGLIVQGKEDKIVPAEVQGDLLNRLRNQRDITIKYEEIEGADHFFSNRMVDLHQIVSAYIQEQSVIIGNKAKTPIRNLYDEGDDEIYENEDDDDDGF
ncbi:MAG: alpha/beta hydrolase [Pseudomonadota bacterium]